MSPCPQPQVNSCVSERGKVCLDYRRCFYYLGGITFSVSTLRLRHLCSRADAGVLASCCSREGSEPDLTFTATDELVDNTHPSVQWGISSRTPEDTNTFPRFEGWKLPWTWGVNLGLITQIRMCDHPGYTLPCIPAGRNYLLSSLYSQPPVTTGKWCGCLVSTC